jgi:hypothetical protein
VSLRRYEPDGVSGWFALDVLACTVPVLEKRVNGTADLVPDANTETPRFISFLPTIFRDVSLPRSQTTDWKILRLFGSIAQEDRRRKPKVLELRQPGEEVQFDLKDGSHVSADPAGKRKPGGRDCQLRRCGHLDLVAP